ncbi:MAG: SCO family protein [Gammaproteobacteria bacterium]|nr:SCO family protein [Gammaproteobacteria bacterium]MBL6998929.1 SCO family protein [Gammaproteobacteria bacterium]
MIRSFNFIARSLLALLTLLGSVHLQAADDFRVIVSIKPVHSIVAGLMKDIGQPVLLIDQQQTPYNFRLTAAHQQQLDSAQLLLWVGSELEKTLQPVIEKLPASVKVVELLSSTDMKILPSRQNPDARDPFFWMDDRNVIILLDQLTELFIQLDPARAHIYVRNRMELLIPLQRIDKEYEYGYRGLKAGLGVMYFDNLNYFEQAYALKTLDRVTDSPWDSTDAINLLKVRSRIQNKEAVCLFIDKSMPAEHLELLRQGQSINVGELDTLGRHLQAGPDLYLQLMAYNTDVIKRCLNADMDVAAQARSTALSDDVPIIDGLGGRYILTNHLGQNFTEQDMQGHYSIIFFGYTSCPDICPTELALLTQALGLLGARALEIQPYFISVDPERDTIKRLNQYVNYFDPRLMGLTGSEQMIRRVADQFKVRYEKIYDKGSEPDQYAMDHSASLYLMAPDGRFVTKFAHGISAQTLMQELAQIMN